MGFILLKSFETYIYNSIVGIGKYENGKLILESNLVRFNLDPKEIPQESKFIVLEFNTTENVNIEILVCSQTSCSKVYFNNESSEQNLFHIPFYTFKEFSVDSLYIDFNAQNTPIILHDFKLYAATDSEPTTHIADDAVTTTKIANGAVTEEKIASASIGSAHIQNAAIDSVHIKDAAVTSAKIANAAIDSAHIKDAAVTNAKIANAAIDSAKIANASIESAHIQNGAINTAHIQAGAIGTAQIADGSITDAKIVSMTANKITAGTIDTGQVTVQGPNGNLRITSNRLQVFDNQPVERVSIGDVNGDGSVYGLRVRSADGQTVLYDHNGVYSEGITNGAVTNPKIADGAVDTRVIAANAVTADKIVAGAVTTDKLAANAVTANKIASGAVTASHIAAGAVQANHISSGSITTSHISANGIDASVIKTGTMLADRIRGGTLELGGSTGGVLSIKDASGAERVRGDTSGITVTSGNFFVVDDVFGGKTILRPSKNMINDHSFELVRGKGSVYSDYTFDVDTSVPGYGNYFWWTFVGNGPHRILSTYGTDDFQRAIFGYQAAVVYGGYSRPMQYVNLDTLVWTDGPYTLSAYVAAWEGTTTSGNAKIEIWALNSAFARIKQWYATTYINAAEKYKWKRISVTVQKGSIPSGTYFLEVTFYGDTGLRYLVDGVQLVPYDAPTDYYPEDSIWRAYRGVIGYIADNFTSKNVLTDRITGMRNIDAIYIGPGQAAIDVSDGHARWMVDRSKGNYIVQLSDGTVYIAVGWAVKHAFRPDGTKTGGTIEIDGRTYGMSPVDSPRVLIQDIITDVEVTEDGILVELDSTLAKAIINYMVIPSRGDVVVRDKTPTSFVAAGPRGKVDFLVIGKRAGYEDTYWMPIPDNLNAF